MGLCLGVCGEDVSLKQSANTSCSDRTARYIHVHVKLTWAASVISEASDDHCGLVFDAQLSLDAVLMIRESAHAHFTCRPKRTSYIWTVRLFLRPISPCTDDRHSSRHAARNKDAPSRSIAPKITSFG